MAVTLQVLSFVPVLPYSPRLVDPTTIAEFAGTPRTARASELERAYRVYPVRRRMNAAAYATLVAFFEARRGPVELFYWKEPLLYARTTIALGTGDGAQTVWPIPSGSPYGGDFPIDDANAIVYVDGVAVSKTTDTDGRAFTLASAAGTSGKAITASYHYYRRVRFGDQALVLSHAAVGTYEVSVELVEEAP